MTNETTKKASAPKGKDTKTAPVASPRKDVKKDVKAPETKKDTKVSEKDTKVSEKDTKKAPVAKKKEPVKKGSKAPTKDVHKTKEIPKATVKKMVLKNVKDDKMRISKEIYGEINNVVDSLMAKHWTCIQKELDTADKRTVKETVLTCFPSFDEKYHLKGADLKQHPFIIAKAVFQNKARSLGGEDKKYLFSKDFLLYYQAFVEAEVADLLSEVIAATTHAKRVTIKTEDVEMVQKILTRS
jgi:histone H3/H4